MADALFVDTVFIQALFDKNDQHHAWAMRNLNLMQNATRVYVSEAVFVEVAAALSAVNRLGAARFIRQCYITPNITVVPFDHNLFLRGLALYESRPDKNWSLVDCVSFLVMQDHAITAAMSTDHHFEQAGFQLIA